MEEIINRLINDDTKNLEKLVAEAFLEHFGFSIHEIEDLSAVECRTYEDHSMQQYVYKNEVFLYLDKEPSVDFANGEVTITRNFKKA